jgi:flagellar hook-associated protein 3 FlgL
MRVTDSMRWADALRESQAQSSQILKLSNEASSGLKVQAPSDDPVAYAAIAGRNAQIAKLDARSAAATQAASDLNLAEGALSSASDILSSAKQAALEAANGTATPASRADAAKQISSLRDQLIALANTKGATGYVFAGTNNGSPPFDAAGNFSGNADANTITIADGLQVTSTASGASAFTAAGGQDIFATLSNLMTALNANNSTGIENSISSLDSASAQVISARVDAGTSAERLQSAASVMNTTLTAVKTAQASDQDADVTQTISDLTAAQTAYQRAVAVTRQILSLTSASGG